MLVLRLLSNHGRMLKWLICKLYSREFLKVVKASENITASEKLHTLQLSTGKQTR